MEIITRLQEYVVTNPEGDAPVGITISCSGKILVAYRLSSFVAFEDVDGAITHIREFLDKNENCIVNIHNKDMYIDIPEIWHSGLSDNEEDTDA